MTMETPSGIDTSVSQCNEATSLPQDRRQRIPASDLKTGNEFDWYFSGKNEKRCRVLKVRRDARTTSLVVKPITQSKPHRVELLNTAPIQIYLESYETEKGRAIAPFVLQVLTEGQPSYSLGSIKILLKESGHATMPRFIAAACQQLTQCGELIERHRAGKPVYRKPLPQRTGLHVVELPGSRSERLGWVTRWQAMWGGRVAPVVCWVDGTESLASEQHLEPVTGGKDALKIRLAQQIAEGDRPVDFVEIPRYLLMELYQTPKRDGTYQINPEVLKQIGELIGIDTGGRFITGENRNRIFDYLELYYPSYKSLCRRAA